MAARQKYSFHSIACLPETQCFTDFTKANPQYIAPDNAMKFISRDDGTTYNQCHCACRLQFALSQRRLLECRVVWTNFEIGDMTFWRGEAYQKFFKFIDDTGGFYYEVRSVYLL